MLLHTMLENSYDKWPEKDAIYYKDKWYSYRELEQAANKIAHFLLAKGLNKGDRVALLLENGFTYVATYYGILKAGGVVVGLNTETTADTIGYLLDNSGAEFFFTDKQFRRYLVPIKEKLESLKALIFNNMLKPFEAAENSLLYSDIFDRYSKERPHVRIINIDLAAIVYTSGSTGVPKGVTLSHLNIATNTYSIVSYLELTERDRIMVVLPFYYIYGMSLLNTHIHVGGSMVIDNRFAFPNVVLDSMETHKVTGFAGVPSSFTILLNKSNIKTKKFDYLRYVTQAGGAMAPTTQQEVVEVFSPAKLFVMYGATEASARLSYLDPAALQQKYGSIGKAIPNVELYVADEHGKKVAQGEQGEIVARGANIMQGYWKDADETALVLKNGLYFTGDLGREDEDGFIFVVGRSKDMVKVGANRISAKEIEEAIIAHENVVEVAIVGVPDEILGEAMDACLVLKEEHEAWEKEILAFTKTKLPPFKVPSYFTLFESLPKNSSGKIMKTKIREIKGL